MSNNFIAFPEMLRINIADPITDFVNYLNKSWDGFFGAIKDVLLGLLNGVQFVVDIIPWWVLAALIFFLGWRSTGKIRKGIVYAVLLLFIGFLGLWELMNMTLAIVIASVIISLLIGLPTGILMSRSEKANSIFRPILDAMQTMPTFVYLIPAVMFFGLGKVPAVIATTIYALPPVIRLTSLAIRQVNEEVVEAARSFGATRTQLLFKVQIPQALPTIMAGINQTMMMAVAMIVTCSMIGAKGLGMEVLIGINRLETGRGFAAGIAIVIIAVLLDRLTQGWFGDKKTRKKKASEWTT